MAGIQNNSERQYNLKQRLESGAIQVVRLKPGLNFVKNEEWDAVKRLNLVQRLKDEGVLVDGKPVKDAEGDIRAMSKTALVKGAQEATRRADSAEGALSSVKAENAELSERLAEMEKKLEELSKVQAPAEPKEK